jgi:hypothetical protein
MWLAIAVLAYFALLSLVMVIALVYCNEGRLDPTPVRMAPPTSPGDRGCMGSPRLETDDVETRGKGLRLSSDVTQMEAI